MAMYLTRLPDVFDTLAILSSIFSPTVTQIYSFPRNEIQDLNIQGLKNSSKSEPLNSWAFGEASTLQVPLILACMYLCRNQVATVQTCYRIGCGN